MDKNRLHAIASGFVRISTQHPGVYEIFVGEVLGGSFFSKDNAERHHGLLVVEVMKMLTGVMEHVPG